MAGGKSRGKYVPVATNATVRDSAAENAEFFDAELAAELAPEDVATGNTNGLNYHLNPSETPEYDSDVELDSSRRNNFEGTSSHLASEQNLAQGQAANMPLDLELQGLAGDNRRLSARERVKNVVTYLFPFKQTYERLHNGLNTGRLQLNAPGRFVGQGTDGVFRNLMAKPDPESTRVGQELHPPTYEEAAADSSPEYWEATMISPMYEDEVFVHGLPVGNVANFVWNAMVTVAFQLVGFVLCYLLHTSHAAKQGTRAGLGITIVMYGYNGIPLNFGRPDHVPTRYEPVDPNLIDISKSLPINTGGAVDTYVLGFVQNVDANEASGGVRTPFLAYAIIAFGILVFLKSFFDFYLIKREEKRILAPRALEETHTTTEAVQHPPTA